MYCAPGAPSQSTGYEGSDRITISLPASIAKHLSISVSVLVNKMSEDSSAVVEESPAAAVAVATAAVSNKVDDDFAIWLRLDSKPGEIYNAFHGFAFFKETLKFYQSYPYQFVSCLLFNLFA